MRLFVGEHNKGVGGSDRFVLSIRSGLLHNGRATAFHHEGNRTVKTIAALFAFTLAALLVVLPARADDVFPAAQRLYLPSVRSLDAPTPEVTATPTATMTPAPTEDALFFRLARVLRCDPNAGVTYANGTVNVEGQLANGYLVAFSYAADGPIEATILSGPHEGYPYWDSGFFSHILGTGGPREGDWHFWIVDENDVRISAIADFHTDGEAHEGSCQQAILKFDTRYPGGTGVLPTR